MISNNMSLQQIIFYLPLQFKRITLEKFDFDHIMRAHHFKLFLLRFGFRCGHNNPEWSTCMTDWLCLEIKLFHYSERHLSAKLMLISSLFNSDTIEGVHFFSYCHMCCHSVFYSVFPSFSAGVEADFCCFLVFSLSIFHPCTCVSFFLFCLSVH